ncbi:3D domain-containing protein [Alicyclobacillus cycloheptanicus]|nr:3D domain-containing protein [Alicyclobacillus cycloheptanicus]
MDKPFRTVIRWMAALVLSAAAVGSPAEVDADHAAHVTGSSQLNIPIISQFKNFAYDSFTDTSNRSSGIPIKTEEVSVPVWCSVSNSGGVCINTVHAHAAGPTPVARPLAASAPHRHQTVHRRQEVKERPEAKERPVEPLRHAMRPVHDAASSATHRARELDNFTLTAYSLDYHSTGKWPSSPGYGITASGKRAAVGRTVAVDPSVIPIGTKLMIEGVGVRIAEDTGGAVKGRHIDILLPSEAAAYQFGVKRHVRVYVEEMSK